MPLESNNNFISFFKNSYFVVLIIGWFVVMGGFFIWKIYASHEEALEKARAEARTLFELNLVYQTNT